MPWTRALQRLRVIPLLMVLASPAPAAGATDVRARHEADAFVDGWIARHPQDATRLGDHVRDAALPLRSPASRDRDAAWYAAQRDSLRALPLDELPPALRIDVKLAAARAAMAAREISEERLPQRDPSAGLAELGDALAASIGGIYSSACSRSIPLRSRLRGVPEFLRDQRLSLAEPVRVGVEQALATTRELLRLCRDGVADEFADCREYTLQADLAVADTIATRAITRYATELEQEILPDARPGLTIDSEGLAKRLELVAGAPVDLPALLARARSEWNAHADALASENGVALDEFRRIDADSARSMLRTIRAILVREKRLPAEIEARIDVSDAPAALDGEVLASYGPWDGRAGRSRLKLGLIPGEGADPATGALREDAMYSFDGARLLLVREGVPGRGTFLAVEARDASRARQALGLDAIRDGWSRYAERVWLETLPENSRVSSERRVHRLERERLARAIAELMLRVEGASVDDAARWLEQGASLSPEIARRAALDAACAPRWAASTVAYWAFVDLRDRAEGATPHFDAAAFHGALLRQGAVPTAWIADLAMAAGGARAARGKP